MANKNFKVKNGLDVEGNILSSNIDLTDQYPTILPTLDLDFTKSKVLDPRITFTRASKASYYDSDGLLKLADNNKARFDHDPTSKQCKGLLIEESRTNLLTYSDCSTASAVSTGTIIVNATTAPDGTNTATLYTENTNNSGHEIRSINATVANSVYTYSVFLKPNGRTLLDFHSIDAGGFNTAIGSVNLTGTGSFSSTTGDSASVTLVNDGWYRVVLTTLVDLGSTSFRIYLKNPGTTYTGDGISGIYLWGAQIELGSFPTSYIPSTDTFTSRASTATYIGSDGLIKTAAINQARYQYNPLNLALAPKLLLEESRTNLLTYSEQFDNAAWFLGNGSITANVTTSPDGTTTADKFYESNTVSAAHTLNESVSFTSGTSYTLSIFAKAVERSEIILGFNLPAFTNYQYGRFNLITGESSTYLGLPQISIVNVGNGWYRCSVTATATTTISDNATLQLHNGTNNIYAGTVGYGVYIWGAQLEQGSYPSSYIPTTTTALTRSADVSSSSITTRSADLASMTDTNFSSWYNQNEGTILCSWKQKDISSTNDAAFQLFRINGGGNDAISARIGYSSFRRLRPFGYSSSTFQYVIDSQYTSGESGIFALGYQKDNSDFALAENGTSTQLDTTGSLSTMAYMTNILIGNDSKNRLNGHISKLVYYPKRLSNTILQNLSK